MTRILFKVAGGPDRYNNPAVRLAEAFFVLAGLSLGIFLGWLMDRSRFALDRMPARIRPGIDPESMRIYALALAVAWAVMALSAPLSISGRMTVPPVGLSTAALAGFAAGAMMTLLAGGPLSFLLGAGATRLSGLVVFFFWFAGVIAGSNGLLAPAVEWLQKAGPRDQSLAELLGAPAWMLFAAFSVALMIALLRVPVRVRIGTMEWPKQGFGFGLLLCAGWGLALYGGDSEGLNAVQAVGAVWEGFTGGRLWLQPSLLVGVGLAVWGFLGACRRREFFSSGPGSSGEFIFLAMGGFLLGLACALAGADPAARLFFSVSSLSVGGCLFAIAFWLGARSAAALEARGKG